MASRIPKRIGPALVATGPTTIYTVPTSVKATIKHVHVANTTAAAVTFTLSIGADAAGTRVYPARSIPAGTELDLFPYWPMVAAEILTASAGTNNILTLTIGYDEELAA